VHVVNFDHCLLAFGFRHSAVGWVYDKIDFKLRLSAVGCQPLYYKFIELKILSKADCRLPTAEVFFKSRPPIADSRSIFQKPTADCRQPKYF